ncbi:hypothetical protein E3N88_45624 [Mikania micrantha]|uniref:NADH:quinone oxidoreductase/Mrp antiporter transmembrane domain-containing protein n=1 Tax=Mikania micrantha TaxID=192012 RepID=A0A5N6LAX3_9ASTR|nr:hypothetical protein E3N88_45624 [Mikania micrantha]
MHAAGVLPAREERKKSDKVKFRFDCLQHGSRLPKKYLEKKKISRLERTPPSSDKGMLPPTIKGKARRREGDAAGKEKASEIDILFSSKTKKAEDGLRCVLSEGNTLFRPRGGMIVGPFPRSARWPIGIAAFGLCLPFLIKNYGSARESAGNNRKEGAHVAAAPPPLSQWGSSIASMILGALAAMAQTKVKRLLAHSSIGHVGYIRTGFSCGTIEGIQSLLIAPVGVVTSVIGRWAAGRLPRVSQFGDRRQFSADRTRSLPNQLRHRWECMLRKIGSSLIHQPSTQYPCTGPQSLHEMNLGLVN